MGKPVTDMRTKDIHRAAFYFGFFGDYVCLCTNQNAMALVS